MDKQKKELEAQLAEQAKVEEVKDNNGLQAIKVTFDGGILFPLNGTSLSANAKKDLTGFANNLINNPGQMLRYWDLRTILGHMPLTSV